MTVLEKLDSYAHYLIPARQRMIFVKHGTNPIHYVSSLQLNIQQTSRLISGVNHYIEPLEVNKKYKFYGVAIEVVDNLNDNLFWTDFTTIDGEKFIGYLNIKYFGILLERIIR